MNEIFLIWDAADQIDDVNEVIGYTLSEIDAKNIISCETINYKKAEVIAKKFNDERNKLELSTPKDPHPVLKSWDRWESKKGSKQVITEEMRTKRDLIIESNRSLVTAHFQKEKLRQKAISLQMMAQYQSISDDTPDDVKKYLRIEDGYIFLHRNLSDTPFFYTTVNQL